MLTKRIKNLINRNSKKLFPTSNAPGFMIIGAQKCGTSSLHYYLDQHPSIKGSRIKEVCYFHRDIYFGTKYSNYRKNFRGPSSNIYFESTPEYMCHPGVAENIHAVLPNIQLIVLLRDPIKRAYSAWNHYKQHFETGKYITAIKNKPRREGNLLYDAFYKDRKSFPSFRECIDIELELIEKGISFEPALLRRGLYLNQLDNYLKYFSEDKIMIVGFQDLIKNTVITLKDVTKFVGAQEISWENINVEPRNTREYQEPMNETDRLFLNEFYKLPNQKLFDEIGVVNW